jgi:hypothetical protein
MGRPQSRPPGHRDQISKITNAKKAGSLDQAGSICLASMRH